MCISREFANLLFSSHSSLFSVSCTSQYDGTVLGGASVCRAEVNETDQCVGGVVLHPCCVGLLGECIITTEENCTFQEGYWHPDKVGGGWTRWAGLG